MFGFKPAGRRPFVHVLMHVFADALSAWKCPLVATNIMVRLGGLALKARIISHMAAIPQVASAPGARAGTTEMES